MPASFSKGDRLVVTVSSQADSAKVWETEKGRLCFELPYKKLISASFSPTQERIIVTASLDGTAQLWEISSEWNSNNCEQKYRLEHKYILGGDNRHTKQLRSAVFSPDGKFIVTLSEDTTAKIWETATGKYLKTLEGHTDWVMSADFSPDGKRIVTASRDGTVRFWDLKTGKSLGIFPGSGVQGNPLISARFSPEGDYVVTAGDDGIARIYPASLSALSEIACKILHYQPPDAKIKPTQEYCEKYLKKPF